MPEPSESPTGVTSSTGPLEAGTLIGGRYRLSSPIATGGMATVWQAQDEVLTRPVAVKVLHARLAADPEFVARFRREAVAAARLAHPAIVSIYDTCDDPEAIVMELVDGRTLRDELDDRRFLPPAEAVEIASGIAQALSVAHRAGLVHRDVKPANVLLSSDGRLKVADFGIAKAAHADDDPELPDLTQIGHMVGTAKYLAPEQVSGDPIDARTDVYALGAVLYEMLCGRAPFVAGNDLATATARLSSLPARPRTILRTIPERLDQIVMKALATDPDGRFSSAAEMWAALQALPLDAEVGDPVQPSRNGPDPTTVIAAPSFRDDRSWMVPVLLVTLVAVALGLAWMLIGGTAARRDLFDLVGGVVPGRTEAPDPEPLGGLTATAFDPPPGDGREGDDSIGLAFDGDPSTSWSTERYDTRQLGGLKEGVGLAVDLGGAHEVTEVVLQTGAGGWAAEVHVADGAPDTRAGWGSPVGSVVDAASGATTIDVEDVRGTHLLLWITDVGTGGDPPFELEVHDLAVMAR